PQAQRPNQAQTQSHGQMEQDRSFRTGTSALGNWTGIAVINNCTVGGLTTTPGTGPGNVISGNVGGIELGNQNAVQRNLVGTDATGLAALGNGGGIHMTGNNNTIGGTTAGARNIISGNSSPVGGYGINIEAFGPGGAQYNLVEGNYIGTDITGTR